MPSDFRFVNGVARGPYANFFTRTDNLFSQSDATPDVTLGNLWYSANTSATTITNFDLSYVCGPNYAQHFEGKEITVWLLDSNTTIQGNNSSIYLAGTDAALVGANTLVRFLYHNSAWYEAGGRTTHVDSVVTIQSNQLGVVGSLDASNRKVVRVLSAAASNSAIRLATGGEQGQELSLFAVGSTFTLTVNSAAANTFVLTSSAATTSFLVNLSGLLKFTYLGNQWIENRQGSNTGSI
jgi:hypothetical protein